MSRRSNASDSNNSMAKCDDSFNDSVHLNDLWFYGPPKKRQMLSPRDSQGDVVLPSVSVLGSKVKLAHLNTLENMLSLMAEVEIRCKRASLVEKSFGELETFPKQRLALAKFEEHAKVFKNTRLFSFEMPGHAGGERRYVVSTLERFWMWYISLSERHVYELIVDSMPCRLYFDLEYCRETNPGIDHEVAYRFFMTTVQDLLKKEFGLEVDPYKDFLVLDSSTESKFSAHVICHLPGGVLFPSNTSMRPFCARLAGQLLEDPPVKIWNTDATKETVLFDSAVYSKNRNFRLFLSSKLGKNAVLKLATYCSFYGAKKPSDQQIFHDSLCIPANAHKSSVLEISEDGQCTPIFTKESAMPLLSSENGTGRSPYPQLDEFMIMIWRKWSPSVFIRQWKLIGNPDGVGVKSIIYYPANCRYCFNIGRQHKSNGTFWTVNFERNEFYQKCFDPECHGVSSNLFPLPSFIASSLHKKDDKSTTLEADKSVIPFEEDDVESFFDESYTELNEFFSQWDNIFEQ